ncbi:hypothetical protein [Streptomyces sp. HUAS ZL42]|uniref:hypothetical protein n=1 Tax=Streptomyces sp. HUAS ZL42 TaxID=3231715 RepID=UPI00345EED29
MSVRPTRLRLLAAVLIALAALGLTGCRSGEGLRDEGPSDAGLSLPSASAPGPTASYTDR